jgi:hypothetical protein
VRKETEGKNINDEDKDADKLPNGSSVQHDLSDRVEASELGEVAAVDSAISAQLEDRTVEEVRIAIYIVIHKLLRIIKLLNFVLSIGS